MMFTRLLPVLVLVVSGAFAAESKLTLTTTVLASWSTLGPVQELGAGITPGLCTDSRGFVHVVDRNAGEDRRAHGGDSG